MVTGHTERIDEAKESLRVLGRLLMGAPPDPALDWEAVVNLAWRHGVSPLLYWRLEHEGTVGATPRGCAVPERPREALRGQYYQATARAIVFEQQLAQVLRALAAAGVPTLVLKGAAIGAFYPDAALRVYEDLDLLVPPEQVDRAEAALSELGYRCFKPKSWWAERFQHLPPMLGDAGPLPIEVHWSLDNVERVGRLPAKDLWARAATWSVEGQPTLRLEVADTILYLCWHAITQHRGHLGLRPLCDLAQVVDGWGQDEWETLARRAMQYGLERPAYLMLTLAEQVLALAAPQQVMNTLRPPGKERLPVDLVEQFLGLESVPGVDVPMAMVRAGAKGTPWARFRHFLWHLFLPRNGMATVYGVPADSLYIWLTYLWRPFDLLRRYGKTLWGTLRGDPRARAAWEREAWLERWLRE